jgi:protein-tyrosine phosphatase
MPHRPRRGYRDLLDRGGHHIVTAARFVACSGPGAVLVHCALGKDRTGVVITMLLDAVGVDRATATTAARPPWLRARGLDRHELHQLRRRLVSTDLAA